MNFNVAKFLSPTFVAFEGQNPKPPCLGILGIAFMLSF